MNPLVDRVAATAHKWDEIAATQDARGYIHPIWWGEGDRGYVESGDRDALAIINSIDLGGGMLDWHALDVGCGDGRVTYAMARLGVGQGNGILVGLDTSPTMLDALADHAHPEDEIRTVQAQPGADWPEMGVMFDLVFSVNLLIHLPSGEKQATLNRIARVLVPGGVAAVQLPLYAAATEPGSWTGVGVWTEPLLLRGAARAGLEVMQLAVSPGRFDPAAPADTHRLPQILRRSSRR